MSQGVMQLREVVRPYRVEIEPDFVGLMQSEGFPLKYEVINTKSRCKNEYILRIRKKTQQTASLQN